MVRLKHVSKILSFILILSTLIGCQTQNTIEASEQPTSSITATAFPTETQREIPTQTPTSVITSSPTISSDDENCERIPSGLCYLSFEPAIDGYIQTFRVTNLTTNEESIEVRKFGPIQSNTQKPGEQRQDRFSYDLISGDDTININVFCLPEGLIVNDIPAMSETGYQYSQHGGESFETLSINYEGVTYIRDPLPGEKWTLDMEWIVKMDTPMFDKFMFTAESEITYVGIETVDVPAGTFTAHRFEMNTTMKLGPLLGGNTFIQFATIPISATSWQADCVGLIKYAYAAMEEEKVSELIEYEYP